MPAKGGSVVNCRLTLRKPMQEMVGTLISWSVRLVFLHQVTHFSQHLPLLVQDQTRPSINNNKNQDRIYMEKKKIANNEGCHIAVTPA